MIWVIANKVEEDGSYPTYRHYRQAFANGEMDIYCAGQDDDFSFLKMDDIVIIRTRDENINRYVMHAQSRIGFKSTLESERTNLLTHDKEIVKGIMYDYGIACPRTVELCDVVDGSAYFVKARYGENSQGIDEDSICRSKSQVTAKCVSLIERGIMPMVEEYIEGEDLTTSVIKVGDKLSAWSSVIHPETSFGFHTFNSKLDFAFTPMPCDDQRVSVAAMNVFEAIGARHYLRIDIRVKDGTPYIIDINMLPGLGPVGHMAKCLEVNGISYHDFIRMVVASAC